MKQLKETDVTEEQLRKSEANLAPDDGEFNLPYRRKNVHWNLNFTISLI